MILLVKEQKSAAKENEKLVVMKSLHIWQSFEDSVVAVKEEISHEKVIKLSSVYPYQEILNILLQNPLE